MRHAVAAVLLLGLAACEPPEPAAAPKAPAAVSPTQPAPQATAAAPFSANGVAETLSPDAQDEIQWAASVVKIDELTRQGDETVKLFGVGGGDPAMNGLQTYVAIFSSPNEGWHVFRIGDFLDYRIVNETPGRVDLEITESVYDNATGLIGTQRRKLIVGWVKPADGAAPDRITVTPAT